MRDGRVKVVRLQETRGSGRVSGTPLIECASVLCLPGHSCQNSSARAADLLMRRLADAAY
jgi:hypothetical protein